MRQTPGLATGQFYVIEIAPNGDIWAGMEGFVAKFNGSEWGSYQIFDESLEVTYIYVKAIAVTEDNAVWVSVNANQLRASNALYRFDGHTWSKEFDNVRVNAIEIGPDGALWIALSPISSLPDSPGGVWRFDGSNWTSLTKTDGLVSNAVNDLTFYPDGTLWLATDGGISAFDGKYWKNFPMEQFCPDQRCSFGELRIVASDIASVPDRTIWFIAQHHALYRYKEEKWTAYENFTLFLNTFYRVTGLCVSNDGIPWMVNSGMPQLVYVDGDNWVAPRWYYDSSGVIYDIQCAPDGAKWIGGVFAIFKYLPNN